MLLQAAYAFLYFIESIPIGDVMNYDDPLINEYLSFYKECYKTAKKLLLACVKQYNHSVDNLNEAKQNDWLDCTIIWSRLVDIDYKRVKAVQALVIKYLLTLPTLYGRQKKRECV